MTDRPNPVFRTIEEVLLMGAMATYNSQAEASQGDPQQWRSFLEVHPALRSSSNLYGASPCTGDGKIHYLTGLAHGSPAVGGESLTLEAGEYAVVRVNETALLRDTWSWLLGSWLANSGRREKHAPELRNSPVSQKPAHPSAGSKSGFPSNHLQMIKEVALFLP